MPLLRRLTFLLPALLAVLNLSACGEKTAAAQTPGAAPPPMEVPVVTVAPERMAISNELPGRLEAARVAQVRARVPGIVQERAFREGSEVKAGEVLFRIEADAYRASLGSTEAALEKAEANLAQANVKVERYRSLIETSAISKQEFDEALSAQKQAAADVAAAKAARATARLNLGYATVTAPISGRIGRALVTEGALVGQGEATPLALIQQLDPIYVNITQSASEALQLRRAMAKGTLARTGKDGAKVTIITDDGLEYPQPGKLLFSDLTVDQSSGAITLRAEVPNPDHFLLPGMYVRARVEQAISEQALAVPQQAVQRDAKGATVFVVGADNKVEVRSIKADAAHDNQWIVSQGLKPGDQVIVEGFQKLRPGAPVKPIPWKRAAPPDQDAPAATAAPASAK